MKRRVIKKFGKFNWPLVGLFLFVFLALLGSIAMILGALPYVKVTKTTTSIMDAEALERNFLWKDSEIPLAVIIDNMKDSWPVSGLEYARIVFEAPVEAGITRFLAIFGSDEQGDFDIGPVRSLRPYFIDWAEEFNTILAHVGGSSESLEKIRSSSVYDLDEFRYGGKYFKRTRDRFAPHNTFVPHQKLKDFLNKSQEDKEINFNAWKTSEIKLSQGKDAKIIFVPYNSPYDVRWEYQADKNNYLRFVNGKGAETASEAQITAKNIVVLKTDITIIDSLSRRRIRTGGAGNALIFRDGKVIEGKWEKNSDFTKFYDNTNAEISFSPGPIWVEVISVSTQARFE